MHKPLKLTSQVPIIICAFSCNSSPSAGVGMENPHTSEGRCEEVMERFNDYAHQRRDLSCPCLGPAPTEQEFASCMSPAKYSKTPIKNNTSEPNLRDSAMEPPPITKKTIHVTHPPQCAAMTRPWSPSASELLGNAPPDCATCHGCKRSQAADQRVSETRATRSTWAKMAT